MIAQRAPNGGIHAGEWNRLLTDASQSSTCALALRMGSRQTTAFPEVAAS